MNGLTVEVPSSSCYVPGYDVLISANVLRKHGSKADFWIWVEMSPDSKLDEMPEEDLRLIKALGIHIRHLEKQIDDDGTGRRIA